MFNLRPYQTDQISKIKQAWRKGIMRLIMQLATGGGKTVMFTFMAKQAIENGNSVLVITDRKELLKQAGSTFEKFGLNADYLTAKQKSIPKGGLVVAMSETIKRRLKSEDYVSFVQSFKLIIIDEAHKRSFDKIFSSLLPDQYVIGATATPDRAGQKSPLADYYEQIIEGVSIDELIKLGFLLPPVYYGLDLDFSNVNLKAGEFDSKALAEYYEKNQVFKNAVENYQELTPGTKAILFASNVADSKRICEEFNQKGISAKHIDADSADRDQLLTGFTNNEFKILCSVDILTTGYDEPSIQTIILFRATMRITLFLQMVGRGSRIFEGLDSFNVLDCGGNINRHNFWCSPHEWSLLSPAKKKKKQGELIVKECPECKALIASGAKKCKYCNYEYPATQIEQMEVLLQRLNPDEREKFYKTATVAELESIRELKGYRIGWLLHQFTTKDQFLKYAKLKGYKTGWAFFKFQEHQDRIEKAAVHRFPE